MSHGIYQWMWLLQVISSYLAESSPYSLQSAVDELNHQEYPLNTPPAVQRPHYYSNGGGLVFPAQDQDYWENENPLTMHNGLMTSPTRMQRNRLNKQLRKFLEREYYNNDEDGGLSLAPFDGYEFDEDNNKLLPSELYTDEQKRASFFRQRDNSYDDIPPSSTFRERELPENVELSDQFLREIEHERQNRYKDALQNLLDKYPQQENELNDNLFHQDRDKRMRVPPYYMLMQRKRSYPVLPWLPYTTDHGKRFPVAKRSPKQDIDVSASKAENTLGKTNENVEKELSELFGLTPNQEAKEKRSVVDESNSNKILAVETTETPLESIKLTDMRLEHDHHQHNHQEKQNDSIETNDDEHNGFKDAKNVPKYDETHMMGGSVKHEDDNLKGKSIYLNEKYDPNNKRQKKSIEWSKYFGLDRKKKSTMSSHGNMDDNNNDSNNNNNDNNKRTAIKYDSISLTDGNSKRLLDPITLENMDIKLQAMEDFIINDTIKYTGANEGIKNPEEIKIVKNRILSRLATAYNLEKMRRALDKLRQTAEYENHVLHNIIEPDVEPDDHNMPTPIELMTKEKYDNQPISPINDIALKSTGMKKKKAFLSHYPDISNNLDDDYLNTWQHAKPLHNVHLINKDKLWTSEQCPIVEAIAEHCRSVDLLSGDLNQELLQLCTIHQICYLCGTSRLACDYQYLEDADKECGHRNNECQAAARSVLIILRGSSAMQLGPRQCLKNSCLHNIVREIGI